MRKLKLAYFGTPDFSAWFLEKLLDDESLPIDVKLVVTQPDKKVGRKQIVTASPVKKVAKKYGVEVVELSNGSRFGSPYRQASNVDRKENRKTKPSHDTSGVTHKLKTIDLALLFAYGEIIPQKLLGLPKHGFWNIHPSLLPKYRGASPVAYPLIAGESETGVTLMEMDELVDHGPIIAQTKVAINPKERRPELTLRLANKGFELFKIVILSPMQRRTKNLSRMRESDIRQRSFVDTQDDIIALTEQDHTQAIMTKELTREDGYIPLKNLQEGVYQNRSVFNIFRGLYPWPGVWTKIRVKGEGEREKEKRVKITDMDVDEKGQIIITKVQLEGKQEVDFDIFNKAYRVF